MAKKEESFKQSDLNIPSQNLEWDPRSETCANGIQRNVIPTGDKVEVKGTRAARPQKPVTWY